MAAATTSSPASSAMTTKATDEVLGDGAVSAENERDARLAVANCPERAIELVEEN